MKPFGSKDLLSWSFLNSAPRLLAPPDLLTRSTTSCDVLAAIPLLGSSAYNTPFSQLSFSVFRDQSPPQLDTAFRRGDDVDICIAVDRSVC